MLIEITRGVRPRFEGFLCPFCECRIVNDDVDTSYLPAGFIALIRDADFPAHLITLGEHVEVDPKSVFFVDANYRYLGHIQGIPD